MTVSFFPALLYSLFDIPFYRNTPICWSFNHCKANLRSASNTDLDFSFKSFLAALLGISAYTLAIIAVYKVGLSNSCFSSV